MKCVDWIIVNDLLRQQNLVISIVKMAQKNSQIDGKIYNVTLQAEISEASTAIKFPCLFYVLWKTNDQLYVTETQRYSQQAGKVNFNETITLTLPLIYERNKQIFLKKETQLQLNLISKSRPDQPKLVGRVTIDLANLINNNLYPTITEFPLQFCSVNASLKASFKVVDKVQTDTSINEMEKSIGDGMSFTSGLKAITIPASVQKSRDSISFGRDVSPIHSKVTIDRSTINREMASRNASPKLFEQDKVVKQSDIKEKKEMTSSSTQEKAEGEDKVKTKSFKINGLIQNCHKKLGSVLSEESRLSDETMKLRGEIDALRLESGRQHEQDERIRKDLQKKLRDNEYVKLQLRQRQTQLDQINSQNNVLRNESVKLREEIAKLRQEAVAGTIKMAELKDNYNRVTAQLSTSERELKRLDIASEQSSEANRNYSEKIQQLQTQIREMENHCGQLQSSKSDLILSLSRKEDDYLKKLEDEKKLLETLETERVSSGKEAKTLKEQIQKKVDEKHQLMLKISSLEQEVKRLIAVEHQFEEARHSWELTHGLVSTESEKKGERVTELEEILMTLNERVRWLEGQNELLNENCRKSREELVRLQEEKVACLKEAEAKYEACFSNLEEERNNIISILNEKSSVEETLNEVSSKLECLSSDHQILTNDHVSLIERQKDLLIVSEGQKSKIQELEELLLSGNQQKQKQLSAAATREHALEIRVKELQQELQTVSQAMVGVENKAGVLEEELKGREDLIIKLQEGLNAQIERTESLNGKLFTYFEKDEKMKDLTLLLEEEERKMNDLINDQEANQVRYLNLINQRQNAIQDLALQLEASQQYGKDLLVVIDSKEKDYDAQLKSLEAKLSEITQLSEELRQINLSSETRIIELQETVVQLQNNHRQEVSDRDGLLQETQQKVDLLSRENSQMISAIADLQLNVQSLNLKITEKQDVILSEMERYNALNEKLGEKETQMLELEVLLQEKESEMAELLSSKAELENQLSIKEEMLQEENRRYSELQGLYDNLANDIASFDVMVWKDEMREKNEQIKKLESDIVMLGTEVSRTAALERSLKIKTIELNSVKFRGKVDPSETNELVRLKDQQIQALQGEKDNLVKIEKEFYALQQEVSDLRGQLEEIEEERFNIESLSNERALMLEQAKEENRKLMDQITIIGEKHGQLQKLMFTTNPQDTSDKPSEAPVKAENIVLKCKVADLQQTNKKLQEKLDTTNQTSVKTIKQTNSNSNLPELLMAVKKGLEERGRGKMQEKVVQTIERLLSLDLSKGKTLQEKTKMLSKDFGRLKIQMMKLGAGKDNAKIISQLNSCQSVIASMLTLLL